MNSLPKSVMNMAAKFEKLSEPQIKKLLDATYIEAKMSPAAIAQLCGTYTNKIRRLLQKHNYSIRSRGEAQSVAIETGRHPHPTKGVGHSDDAKLKISEKMGEVWENLTDDEREHRSILSKEQWDAMSEAEKKFMRDEAGKAVRHAAKFGSKLENYLHQQLLNRDYDVKFHQTHFMANTKLTLDLYLPIIKTVIEVDGPSHFSPIWGEETLARNKRSDAEKDGLLLGMGLVVLRVQQRKALSEKYKRDILARVLEQLEKIQKKFPTAGNRHITLGD